MIKISFTGSHGTGKTTSVLERARELKLAHPTKKISVLTEVASECPFELNKASREESQVWIFTNQCRREVEYSRKSDYLVCDRTVCDSIAYSIANNLDCKLISGMMKMAAFHINSYSEIYFKTIKNNDWWYADGLRDSSDLEWRKKVEEYLLEVYDSLRRDYGCKFNFVVI